MSVPHKLLRRLVVSEGGYSLVELLAVMAILSTVLGAATTLFVRAQNAEVRMNKRFQAQQQARLALDQLRREAHCAEGITPVATTTSAVMLTMQAQCPRGGGSVTWCTRSADGTTTRYALYRVVGAACGTSGGTKVADYLLTPTGACNGCLFTYTNQTASRLGSLHVELPVNITPATARETYQLRDDIVLRNTTRS